MTTANEGSDGKALTPEQLNALAVDIGSELSELEDQDVLRPGIEALRRVWSKYYLTVGHRRLGRILIGRYGT